MKLPALVLLAVAVLLPVAGEASFICTDERGRIAIQDTPCPQKKASTTNVPIKADELSDQNAVETVHRFYRAMTERDPGAAARFLADTFTAEVRKPGEPPANDTKASFTEVLRQVMPAIRNFTVKVDCRVAGRSPAAYSLTCRVEEQGNLGAQKIRSVSDETMTIVIEGGFARIGRIVADQLEESEQIEPLTKRG